MNMDKVAFHVISHTHWDREWYLPFEVFRFELVELIDNLLDILKQNNSFIFHLDGQTIILQDYLEIRPEKREQIRKFVKSGNLLIGPWYVLSDQFLTSGEALIRNLLYGIKYAKELGNVMLVGYLPDQFGQIAQLPQIFKGFNINTAIVGRGIQDSIAEHNWYGLNGDCTFTLSLTHWYNNAQRFPVSDKELHKYLQTIYETQKDTSISKHILLMNGCDHLFPQGNLKNILSLSNGNEHWTVEQSSLLDVLEKISQNPNIENYPICFGELRSDNNKYILAGTLSTRVYLKLENYKCQTKLEKIIEPLSVMVDLVSSEKLLNAHCSALSTFIEYAWKLLIQNHSHDSICGCSVDEVHKEMETRFAKVKQVANKLEERLLSVLSDCRDAPMERLYIQLINLTNYHRKEIIEAEIEFPLGPVAEHPSNTPTINKDEIKSFNLKKAMQNIDFEMLENYKTFKMVRSKEEVPLLQAVQKVKILFEANSEPFSITSYEIIKNKNTELSTSQKKNNLLSFRNEHYELRINQNGTLNISLENNQEFKQLHYLLVEDDLGDEYNFVPNDTSNDYKWDIKILEENNFRKRFLLSSSVVLSETKDDMKEYLLIEIEITCYLNSKRIDFKTKLDNRLKNKRVRLHFPDGLNTNYIYADTQFGVLQRARPPVDWVNYAFSQALYNWIDHSNNEIGLAFFGGGLADYELYENGNGFAVTLIRSVGRLSTVKSHSLIETPEAQCNREIKFNYALYPHIGDWQNGKVYDVQLLHQIPILTKQSTLNINVPSILKISSELVISSLRKSDVSEKMYILRLFNPLDKEISNCFFELDFKAKEIYLLTLNEEIEQKVNTENGRVVFNVQPFQILTFGIEV